MAISCLPVLGVVSSFVTAGSVVRGALPIPQGDWLTASVRRSSDRAAAGEPEGPPAARID
jgi:hypothetical protein